MCTVQVAPMVPSLESDCFAQYDSGHLYRLFNQNQKSVYLASDLDSHFKFVSSSMVSSNLTQLSTAQI